MSRAEEGLHEALQESLAHILPTTTPFLSATNTQVHCMDTQYHVSESCYPQQLMMTALLERFPDSPASYRRMAASVLRSLTTHSKSPEAHTHWLVGKLMSKQCSSYVSQ